MRSMAILGLVLVAALGAGPAPAGMRWLHVRVNEPEKEGTVRVNVPVSMVQTVLPALLKQNSLRGSKVEIDRHDVTRADVRRILDAVRDAEEGEFVVVETRRGRVRVAREEGVLRIESHEIKKRSSVRARLPLSVAEALLEGEGKELNVQAAVEALDAHGGGEVLVVEEEETRVRIWIDEKSG